MTEDELAKLDYCCKATGKSRSEIVREGIKAMYAYLQNLEKE